MKNLFIYALCLFFSLAPAMAQPHPDQGTLAQNKGQVGIGLDDEIQNRLNEMDKKAKENAKANAETVATQETKNDIAVPPPPPTNKERADKAWKEANEAKTALKNADEKKKDAAKKTSKTKHKKARKAMRAAQEDIKKFKLYGPYARLAVSVGIGTISTIIWQAAKKQKERIQKNIDELTAIRDGMVVSSNGINDCSENDFEDSSKPTCYCYLPSGEVNYGRDPEGPCKSILFQYNPSYASQNHEGPGQAMGCVTMQGNFDKDCRCRKKKVKNKKGKTAGNACMKVKNFKPRGLGGKAAKVFSNAAQNANSFLNGTHNKVSASDMKNYKSLVNFAKKKAEKSLKLKKGKLDRIINSKINSLLKSPAIRNLAAMSTSMSDSGKAQLASSMSRDMRKGLDKKSLKNLAKSVNSYKKSRRRSSGRYGDDEKSSSEMGEAGEFEIDFGDEEMEEAMEKKYKYAKNDIFNNSSASIFQVLSVRYQKSAFDQLVDREE